MAIETNTSAEPLVHWQSRSGVGYLTLNRPSAGNAIDLPLARALAAAADEAVHAVAAGRVGAVLIAAQGRQFCVGGDIQAFVAHRDALADLVRRIVQAVHPALHQLATLPVPVVSAVQGSLGGAGIALALCADFVLASDVAKLRGGYTAIGLSPDAGASWFVTRRAGAAAAKRIFMRNPSIPAAECLRLGLVDELHTAAALPAAAARLAQELAQGATGALARVKRLCDHLGGDDLLAHLQREEEDVIACAGSADCREGVQAFMEKRPPRFARGVAG